MEEKNKLEMMLLNLGYKQHGSTTWYTKQYDSGLHCEINIDPQNPKMVLRDRDHHLIDDDDYDSSLELHRELERIHETIYGSTDTEQALEMILPATGDIVLPAVSVRGALAAWNEYQSLCRAILDENDYQQIKGGQYKRKSAWRKLARMFNLSDEIVEAEKIMAQGSEDYTWRFVVRVTAPNGRTALGVGMCSTEERNFAHKDHDVYATAHTRAKNRAISDIIGAGEVSAEEIQAG